MYSPTLLHYLSRIRPFSSFHLLLTLLLFCDLSINLSGAQDNNFDANRPETHFAQIHCLSNDSDCEQEQRDLQNLMKTKSEVDRWKASTTEDYGFLSSLDVPLPRPGYLCNSDDECDTDLKCVLLTLNDSPSFSAPTNNNRRKRSQLPVAGSAAPSQQRICAHVAKRRVVTGCNNRGLQCPHDSFIDVKEHDGYCYSFCKCLSKLDLSERCESWESVDCTTHPLSDYLTPGNCCSNCKPAPPPQEPSPPKKEEESEKPDEDEDSKKSEKGEEETSAGKQFPDESVKQCEVRNGNGVRIYAQGIKWFEPLDQKNDNYPCKVCECRVNSRSVIPVCDHHEQATNCPSGQKCIPENSPYDDKVCCPTCKPCFHKNIYYNHSDTWLEIDSDCETCTCDNAERICHQYSCEPLQCSGNWIEHKEVGECCPKCTCPSDMKCSAGLVLDSKTCTCFGEIFNETTTETPPVISSTNAPDHVRAYMDKWFANTYVQVAALALVVVIPFLCVLACCLCRKKSKTNQNIRPSERGRTNLEVTKKLLHQELRNQTSMEPPKASRFDC